jgi:excisionase family DNA binding protein
MTKVEMLTIEEVADRTGLSRREIHRRIRGGLIPVELVDGQRRVRASWVDRFTGVTR